MYCFEQGLLESNETYATLSHIFPLGTKWV